MSKIKDYKLDLLTSRFELSGAFQALRYIKITKENAIVCDSHAIAVVPSVQLFEQSFIDTISEEGFYIDSKNYKLLSKLTGLSFKDESIIEGYSNTGVHLISILGSKSYNYPNTEQFFSKKEEDMQEKSLIKINCSILYKLTQAMGCKDGEIRLEPYSGNAYIVHPNDPLNSSKGFMMGIF